MRIRLRLDGRRPRRWWRLLAERLGAEPGRFVELDDRPGSEAWPAEADRLFRIETLAHGLPRTGPAARLDGTASWPRPGPAAPDLVIDLCGDVEERGIPVRRLLFDGKPGETALLRSLLAGRVPVASVVEGGRVLCAGRLGTEVRGVALTMFEDALARGVTLLAASFTGGAAPFPAEADEPSAPQRIALGRRAARIAAGSAVRRLYRLGFHAPHWRIGWRRLDGPDLLALRDHPRGGWHELPDDGKRFYADPFPLVHRGHCWLFVEEFPHATGKGVISAVEFGADGPLGAPAPVLETRHHLSYPFVFERDGAVWMVPESCANGSIDLYRATAFPEGWVKEATLVADVAASDATLVEHGGRWWLFATVRGAPADAPLGNGSFSDALHLWSAPDFRGPWTAHPRNPVLIDIASARPAGRIVARDGALIRPVQDCARGYGHRLGLWRIDRLDDEGFSQSHESTIGNGPAWPGTRVHTLNAAGGFEFIDGSARVPRFWPKRRRP